MSQTDMLEKLPAEVRSMLVSLYTSPAWPFHEAIAGQLIESIKNELTTISDPVAIYKAQGKIEGIRLLLGFKDTLFTKQPKPRF